ncbi:phosphotransferase enzyme family protein [Zymoseptoria brevis]|uniref:Altered inheritance of mitochondria protein 9, mitochondrial n=1 Tax=Zymoseptoria brevis TaxID=1047168 RepID=A0A0F4GIW7_9PEZI|nr:phosphotransferase enzyme family protein [Zymoseptoria brevis]
MACRWRKFNTAELAQAAAPAAGSRSCVKLAKLSEGSFNKAFVLTMDDGKEIIAKIPNPNAGYEHFTTASEVATMDYARNILGVPVPQVYAWNSSADNPVGAEYILMEKCPGIELHKVWDTITDRQKAAIIHRLVSFEAAFASLELPMYGSLYYAKDLDSTKSDHCILPPSGKDTRLSAFAIGPTTDRNFFDHGRAGATANQGPWLTVEEYNFAIAEREKACLQRSSQFPDPQGFYNGPGQYQQISRTKLQILQDFEKVAQYLKPTDPILSKPVFWHTDLHWDNIFVDENDPTEITAIIDWQAVHVAPLFAQARHPNFLEFDGEIPDTFDADAIKLPENFEDLSEEEQQAAKKLRGAQILWKLYEVELICQCDDINRAIRFGKGLLGRLPSLAGNIFSDGELLVQDLLMSLQQEWSQVVDDPVAKPCPLSFTDADQKAHDEQFVLWTQSIELMTDFLTSIGGYRAWDGSVSHEQYNTAKEHMRLYKEDFISRHSSTEAERTRWLEVWPFPD